MSDVLSAYDSGPESEFDFKDFLEEEKGDQRSAIAKIRSKINKGAIVMTAKQSTDPTRPPLLIGKQVPSNSDLGGLDPDKIIEMSKSKPQNLTENSANDLRNKIDNMRKIRGIKPIS
jgi:hypothetical protein